MRYIKSCIYKTAYNKGRTDMLKKHFKLINKILNKYSLPLSKGGLDYVKAFKEMEKYEYRLSLMITK